MPWYRTVEPENELGILAIRSKLGIEDMRAQQPRVPTTSQIKNFTTFSAFHYLANGTRQRYLLSIKVNQI